MFVYCTECEYFDIDENTCPYKNECSFSRDFCARPDTDLPKFKKITNFMNNKSWENHWKETL